VDVTRPLILISGIGANRRPVVWRRSGLKMGEGKGKTCTRGGDLRCLPRDHNEGWGRTEWKEGEDLPIKGKKKKRRNCRGTIRPHKEGKVKRPPKKN